MGKGQRGGQEEAVSQAEQTIGTPSYGMADTAAGIYYGGPNISPQQGGGRADPRNRVPSIPHGDVAPSGGKSGGEMPQTPKTIDEAIEIARRVGYGGGSGPKDLNADYWRQHWDKDPEYAFKRMLGWQAGGSDVATSGPYAGGGGGGQGVSGPGAGGVAGMGISNYLDLMNRYGEFAETGGYDQQTLDAIRSRSLSPVRAAYSDANRAIDRSRSLTGDYAPGYAATKAKAAREQSYTLADATTNTEGMIGQMVQQGRMGGLQGMSSLYGATPGLASMFGNQALQSRSIANQTGLGLLDARQNAQNLPGAFQQTMGRIGSVGGALYPFLSDRNAKKNIKPIKGSILHKLRKLPISTWSYKDDPDGTIHIGPMAQDFKTLFGGNDDTVIHPVDVAGVTLRAVKELAEAHGN